MRRVLLPAAAVLLPLAGCSSADPDALRTALAAATASPEAPVAPDADEGVSSQAEEERSVLEPFEVPSELVDAEGSIIGSAFLRADDRGTELTVEVSGLPAGYHGLGLFAVGDCTPGDGDAPFGAVGDQLLALPPVPVLANGSGLLTVLVDEAPEVDQLLLDDGTAVVLGSVADEVTGAQPPSDGSGVACAAFGEGSLPEATVSPGDEQDGFRDNVDDDVDLDDDDDVDAGTGGLDQDPDDDEEGPA